MLDTDELTPGDPWPGRFRGYRLQTNADGEVWWQPYRGTERLHLEPTPTSLVDDLLSVDRLGGRVRVTEGNSVLTRVAVGDDYEERYVGDLELFGELVPPTDPDYAVPVRPGELSSGDLWPSVYDGAKFSFAGDRVWWQSGDDHRRHPVETPLPESVRRTLDRLKPDGGSFRVTPWGDVLTLVSEAPDPERTREQLRELPRVVKNVITLRRERGVEMLPVYVGSLSNTPLEVGAGRSLTEPLSDGERADLESWASSLGPTTDTSPDRQSVDRRDTDDGSPTPEDDPETW